MSLTRTGFQSFVNTNNPPGNIGDFASMNPRAVVLAGPGALKVGSGVTVGYFARADLSTGLAEGVVSPGSGIIGFVANETQALITAFLGQSNRVLTSGYPVTLYTHGDFWTLVAGGAVTIGATIYAVAATGQPTVDSASAANPDTGFIAATAAPADATATTCSIAADTGVLTVATLTGTILQGMNVSGTGVPADLFIQYQITGTAGAAGTYQLNYQGPAVTTFAGTFSQGRLVKISRTF
jgi:hypothetical protein